MTQVQVGDRVEVHYTGRLASGDVFANSQGDEPLRFAAGRGEVIEGISQAVLGMEQGGRKTVTVPPEQGFGPRREDLQRRVPRGVLPPDVTVGDQLVARGQEGQERLWVRELADDFAVLDGNHPLAGQTLTFDLELLSVEPGEQPA
ncbi:MAG TPA: peptidylprolyl isomerase [Gemmataceae bacterium]|nr:peptidylprolyl isomerase [Gemmataceae bacterium]